MARGTTHRVSVKRWQFKFTPSQRLRGFHDSVVSSLTSGSKGPSRGVARSCGGYRCPACWIIALALIATGVGCRGHQYAHVLRPDQADMVGSHEAGAETFNPLIADAVAQLLGRQVALHHPASFAPGEQPVSAGPRICFIGVENRSSEELGDFKDQIYQQIDTQILQANQFHPVSKRFVDAGLRESRLRPDSLFLPANRQVFADVMEQMGQPFDFLLYATITSGTTQSNHSYQRDYMLTLEMVDIRSGQYDKQSATIRKGYHRTRVGRLRKYNPFQRFFN